MSSEPGLKWAKRVIALPGDTVEVKDKEVFVNGQQLPHEPVPRASLGAAAQAVKGELFEETNAGRRYRILFATDAKPLPDCPKTKVPDGMCFVLGDNRSHSATAARSASWPLATCSATYSTGTGQPRRGPGSASRPRNARIGLESPNHDVVHRIGRREQARATARNSSPLIRFIVPMRTPASDALGSSSVALARR